VLIVGGTTDSGISISSDNPVKLITRDLDHYSVAFSKNDVLDVNGHVFESSPALSTPGIRIRIYGF
jgi:hypothetical protein